MTSPAAANRDRIVAALPRIIGQRWMIEVRLTDTKWRRVGTPYRERATARSWLSFVKSAWHVRHARTVLVDLWQVSETEAEIRPRG